MTRGAPTRYGARAMRGATLLEYVLLVGFLAVVALAGFRLFGRRVLATAERDADCVASLDGAGCKNGSSDAGSPRVARDQAGPASAPRGAGRMGAVALALTKVTVGDDGATCVGGTCVGGTCFVAGTPVATPGGLVAIESLRPGDVVLTADPADGSVVERHVVQTFETPRQPVLDLAVTASGGAEQIGVTPSHRFWVQGRGWVAARDLGVAAAGLDADGRAVELATAGEPSDRATVYNLEVEDTHTYFVGRARVLVHNDCLDDADKGELHDAKRRQAIEKIAEFGPYNKRAFGILANAAFGEQQAKDAYEKIQWQRHEARQLTFDGYWYLRKEAERQPWFPNSWKALSQALYEGNRDAIEAVKELADAAKKNGAPREWGGERLREAERLMQRHAPLPSSGKPGDKFILPAIPKATRDLLEIDHQLGVADYWSRLSDSERTTVNEALEEVGDKNKQAKLLKELAGDAISERVGRQPPQPGDEWLDDFPPPVQAGIKKLSPLTRAAMEQRWFAIDRTERRRAYDQIVGMALDGASQDVLGRTLYNKLVPPTDSLGRALRYEISLRDGQMSFPAYVELLSRQIPVIAAKERELAAAQEQARKTELVERIQKIMADPGLMKRGKRDAKFLEVAERGDLAHLGHTALGFGKQGVDTVVGIGHMVIHPIETSKGLWFAVTNPDKSIPAILVSIDESYHDDPDQFMGRIMFEVTLAAATAGGGEGADLADKARRFATLAKEARDAGDLAKAIRYAQTAEKLAVRAEKAAAKAKSGADAARVAAEARGAANGARELAGAAKTELVTRAEKMLSLAEDAFPRYAKELEPAKEAVKKALGDFGEIQARAKDPVSAANRLERAVDRFGAKVEALDDVVKNLWDAIGTRVVLKDTSPAAIDKLVDRLAAAIKSGELKVESINNLHGPGGKPYLSPQQIERLQQAAAEAGRPLKVNTSKVMESGYTVVCAYLEHGNGVRGELQIIGEKALELANVEHIPYDVSLGKALVRAIDPAAVPEMQRIVRPVEEAMAGFTKEKWAEYNAYLNDAYTQARNAELGVPSRAPKLPEGFPEVLSVEGLKRIESEIKALKAKYPDAGKGLTPQTRLLEARPPAATVQGAVDAAATMPKKLAAVLSGTEAAEVAQYTTDLTRVAAGIEKNPLATAGELAKMAWPKVKVAWDAPIEMGESQFARVAKAAEELAKQAGVTKAEALEYLIDEKFNTMLSVKQAYFYDPKTGVVHVPRDFVVYKDAVKRPLNVADPVERAFAVRHARAQVEEFAHGAGSAVRAGEYAPLTPRLHDFSKWLGEPAAQAWLKTKLTADEIAELGGKMHEADITALLHGRSPHGPGELGRYKIREAYEEFVRQTAPRRAATSGVRAPSPPP